MRAARFSWLLLLAAVAPARAQLVPLPAQAPDVPWPTHEWPTGTLPETVAPRLNELLRVVADKDPLLGQTRAVMIVQHGRIVSESYAPGYSATTRLISWSMAKSITQALVGIAVRQGLVDIDKPMGNPRWPAGDARQAIPWRQWEQMVDGQRYHEIDRMQNPASNDAARMLFGEGRRDVAAFGASLPLDHPPGTHWNYNSAGVNLVCDALGRVWAPNADAPTRRARMLEVMRKELFEPLGMTSAQPEFDSTGTFIGSAFVYATARDFARFGLLYLRDGVWDGQRILPAGWVDSSWVARASGTETVPTTYGYGWWGHTEGSHAYHYALGFGGQFIVVVPDLDLVLVRHGASEAQKTAVKAWVADVVQVFRA